MPTSYEPEQWGFPPRSLTSASCARVKGVREVPRQGRDPCRANVAFLTEGQQALRHEPFRRGIRALAERLPILWQGSVIDGELTAGRFSATMAALYGSREHAPNLRFVVFDVPVLAGVDLRMSRGTRDGSGWSCWPAAFDRAVRTVAARGAVAGARARHGGRQARGHRPEAT